MDKNLLRGFADNTALMAAVKELLLKHFSVDSLEATNSDELLGQMVRARLVGLKTVEAAWKELDQYRTIPTVAQKPNPAY